MIFSSIDGLADIRKESASNGKVIVFTNGVFDILHAGHVTYLQAARELGDALIVGVNTDASVKRLKGADRPVNTLEDRLVVLHALGCVDHVVAFDEDTPISVIESLKPDVLVKGGDYTRDTVVGAEFVEANGGKVCIIPLVEGRSTTAIINRAKTV